MLVVWPGSSVNWLCNGDILRPLPGTVLVAAVAANTGTELRITGSVSTKTDNRLRKFIMFILIPY
jgi:hypothetical protein